MWKPGDRLTHRHNPELGLGRVLAVDARSVHVEFPRSGVRLRLAATSPALSPIDFRPGQRVRGAAGGEATIAELLAGGRVRLADGRELPDGELWPVELDGALLERLAHGDVDPVEDFELRLDALHLAARREARGLGSFLGGRIRLFPHQLHAAERATAADPVRWLLADEVGLGKTVEACLILNRLVRTGRAERVLIVTPDTLAVQWLGELWRKHHQVFVLLDEPRLADVARDFGRNWSPFDVHRQVIVSIDTLVHHARLTEQAVASGIDLLIVDEAHHLQRPPGQPGNAEWRAVAPIAALGRHVLLLTATPLEDDAHGFFRLLQLLRPEALPETEDFSARLRRREPLPPCTSSTRRVDVGGLPPRVGEPVEAEDPVAWRERVALVDAVRGERPPKNPLERRRRLDQVRRARSSGAALAAVLDPEQKDLRATAAAADATDPRIEWLVAHAQRWKRAGHKSLIFTAYKETLELVRTALSHRGSLASAAFHEDLSPARRDIEVAQFRQASGPSLLVTTECGGEGRNFEFCHRLVLFDLPWDPVVVEQRIGRLDRIGRTLPVAIAYFRPPSGLDADVARLFEALGLFREPLAGLEPDLAGVVREIEAVATSAGAPLVDDAAAALTAGVGAARSRIRDAAYHELHRDRYQASMAPALLARVPQDLDSLNQDVVVSACERLGFRVVRHTGHQRFSIEFGNEALVDSLPGVPGGTNYLGSFDREEAVLEETLDFFASGHPLVEGILAHLEEAPLGRVTALSLAIGRERGAGLLALYKEGPVFEAVVVDAEGRRRDDWAALFSRRPLQLRRVPPARLAAAEWATTMRRLGAALDPARRPLALAGLDIGP